MKKIISQSIISICCFIQVQKVAACQKVESLELLTQKKITYYIAAHQAHQLIPQKMKKQHRKKSYIEIIDQKLNDPCKDAIKQQLLHRKCKDKKTLYQNVCESVEIDSLFSREKHLKNGYNYKYLRSNNCDNTLAATVPIYLPTTEIAITNKKNKVFFSIKLSEEPECMVFHPHDKNIFACATNKNIKLYNIPNQEPFKTLNLNHFWKILQMIFSPYHENILIVLRELTYRLPVEIWDIKHSVCLKKIYLNGISHCYFDLTFCSKNHDQLLLYNPSKLYLASKFSAESNVRNLKPLTTAIKNIDDLSFKEIIFACQYFKKRHGYRNKYAYKMMKYETPLALDPIVLIALGTECIHQLGKWWHRFSSTLPIPHAAFNIISNIAQENTVCEKIFYNEAKKRK